MHGMQPAVINNYLQLNRGRQQRGRRNSKWRRLSNPGACTSICLNTPDTAPSPPVLPVLHIFGIMLNHGMLRLYAEYSIG